MAPQAGDQQAASDAGLAPRVVHIDEATRAVVSEFVVDRSLAALVGTPATRDAAIDLLGHTVRRVHALPLPADAEAGDPRALLAGLSSGLASFGVPDFAAAAARRVTDETPPPAERPAVLGHNDMNPTNLVYDGERVVLLDWDVAGPNEPFYDLAALAVFLRMEEATCLRMLSAYDGAPVTALSPRFCHDRRLVAVLCGTAFLHLARAAGYPGGAGETLDATPSLVEQYQRMRRGEMNPATADGRWWFGLALIKESLAL